MKTGALVRLIGVEPTQTRRRRAVLYPLSYRRIYMRTAFCSSQLVKNSGQIVVICLLKILFSGDKPSVYAGLQTLCKLLNRVVGVKRAIQLRYGRLYIKTAISYSSQLLKNGIMATMWSRKTTLITLRQSEHI